MKVRSTLKERNQEHKKETTHPILIWIIASILFHMLLALISIVLHIDDYRDTATPKKDDRFTMSQQEKKSATMMLDQIKKPITQSTKITTSSPAKEKPVEKPVKPEDPALIHTLIPGRQGLDLQNITDQLSNAQGEKPKEITTPKPVEEKKPTPQLEPKKAQAPKSEEMIEKKEQHKKLSENASNLYEAPKKDTAENQDASMEQEQVQKSVAATSLDQTVTPSQEVHSQKVPSQSNSIDHYQFVPKQTMSLKDLQLGFNKFLNNVGNTECLIQHGNTSAVPGGQSLKNITYKNQFAKTMIGSIHAHPKARTMQYKRDKQISFVITIDRKGKLLDLQVTKESGDPMIDSIIIESLNTAGLYPSVPNFILDDPYVQQWTILY